MQLNYHGVSYPYVAPEVVTPLDSTKRAIEEQARTLMLNHHRCVKQREQAMLIRMNERVGLPISEAIRFWNPVQGKVPSSHWPTYDRSPVTMS
jgi:hypothetical protein